MTSDQKKLFGIKKLNIKRSIIPAVTHVDYSARVQTVNIKTNPRFYNLISKFKESTGCKCLINTSFNVAGDPIVHDLIDCYTNMQRLGVEYLITESGLFKLKASE